VRGRNDTGFCFPGNLWRSRRRPALFPLQKCGYAFPRGKCLFTVIHGLTGRPGLFGGLYPRQRFASVCFIKFEYYFCPVYQFNAVLPAFSKLFKFASRICV
jgi:hypothetical protein